MVGRLSELSTARRISELSLVRRISEPTVVLPVPRKEVRSRREAGVGFIGALRTSLPILWSVPTEADIVDHALAARKLREMGDPADLNGDDCLWGEWLDAYIQYHQSRNTRNHEQSRRDGVRTKRFRCFRFQSDEVSSPARAALDAFFLFAAKRLATRFAEREITILDLGCGSGPCRGAFERAGLRGTYIGVDIARHSNWSDLPTPAFRNQLIIGDAMTMDPGQLPRPDLIVSATALEHIRDDLGVIQRWGRRLKQGGAQVHLVPAESSLQLYRGHGWRQYSPGCLRRLFPDAEIYRVGGPVSSWLHRHAITNPEGIKGQSSIRHRRPKAYVLLRTISLCADTVLGNPKPSSYGVICNG